MEIRQSSQIAISLDQLTNLHPLALLEVNLQMLTLGLGRLTLFRVNLMVVWLVEEPLFHHIGFLQVQFLYKYFASICFNFIFLKLGIVSQVAMEHMATFFWELIKFPKCKNIKILLTSANSSFILVTNGEFWKMTLPWQDWQNRHLWVIWVK